MKKSKNNKEIGEYLQRYIFVIIILIIVIISLILVLNHFYLISVLSYIATFLIIYMYFIIIDTVKKYRNLKKIQKYLLQNQLIDKIGEIEFSNYVDYILAKKYMIIISHKNIYCYSYKDIEKIENRTIEASQTQNIIVLTIKNQGKISLHPYAITIPSKCKLDVKEYLIQKNPNIN